MFYDKFSKICDGKGITMTRALRHEFATICLDAGLTAKEAITITGHAEAATLENIYQHIRDSRKTENADKLNQFVSGGRV